MVENKIIIKMLIAAFVVLSLLTYIYIAGSTAAYAGTIDVTVTEKLNMTGNGSSPELAAESLNIKNNSTDTAIAVDSITAVPLLGWEIVNNSTDFVRLPVNAKKVALKADSHDLTSSYTNVGVAVRKSAIYVDFAGKTGPYTIPFSDQQFADIITTISTTGIPSGGVYTVEDTGEILTGGELFPETVKKGDLYSYGDYEYKYGYSWDETAWVAADGQNGWGVRAKVLTKTSYGMILDRINEAPIISLQNTFYNCAAMTKAPEIPDTVTIMQRTFGQCVKLTASPVIPDSVTNMRSTFYSTAIASPPLIPESATNMYATFALCANLTTAPKLPESVTNMAYTFSNCILLNASPVIPNKVTNMTGTFRDCEKLTKASTIPTSVTIMEKTFNNCTSLTTPPTILGRVTNMYGTFMECTKLTTAPTLPNTVTNIRSTFYGTAIVKAPAIPNSVTEMYGTFASCNKLTTPPTISTSCPVTNMYCAFNGCSLLAAAPLIPMTAQNVEGTFKNCTALKGNIIVNANPDTYVNFLYNTVNSIKITGTCTTATKKSLKDTANNGNVTY